MRFLIVASAVLVLSASVRRAGAQTVETPIAFDSAQRVTAVTPALAERLHLAAPVWLSAALAIANPARARASGHRRVGSSGERSRVQLSANGPMLLRLLQRRPGVYPLLRVIF